MKRQHKIMIVEDEGVIAMNLRRKLEQMGFSVTKVVDNGEDALAAAAETRPDLVMMDIIIQGEDDGIETAHKLRHQQDVPIIFLTAHSDEGTIQRAKSAMPYGYLIKPFEERELKTTIEMALYRHENQLAQRLQQEAISLTPVGIVIADARQPGLPVVISNRAFEEMTGYTAAEVKGKGLFGFYGPETDSKVIEGLQDVVLAGGTSQARILGYRADGGTFWAEKAVSPVRDFAGAVTHYLAILQDVSERVEEERHARRAQRLEAIGTLAGGVAHDLNNVLSPIMMGLDALSAKYPDEVRTLEMFRSSIGRGADMVKQLLSFVRGSEGERTVVEPAQLVKEIYQIMMGTFPKNIKTDVSWDPDLPSILGDPTQLHQILLNLCVNARDAMPDGGTLTLEAKRVQLDEERATGMQDDIPPGGYVLLRVRDTGSGIPPEIREHIFEPFFTTKEVDKGTGLGLSTVLGIIKGHGGTIEVSSEMGEGTTFTVYLPVPKGRKRATAKASARTAFRGRGRTVLFVDDELPIREVVSEVLDQLEFEVLTAKDGKEGMLLAVERRADLDVVVTDLNMPEMDGFEFIRMFGQLLPETPVVVISGILSGQEADTLRELGVLHHIAKPFSQDHLLETLQAALERGKA